MSRKLYVGNIGDKMTVSELETLFTQVGAVNRVRIATDVATGERKNFGYVEMATQEAADAAIESMNGYELNDRKLRVREARSSSKAD